MQKTTTRTNIGAHSDFLIRLKISTRWRILRCCSDPDPEVSGRSRFEAEKPGLGSRRRLSRSLGRFDVDQGSKVGGGHHRWNRRAATDEESALFSPRNRLRVRNTRTIQARTMLWEKKKSNILSAAAEPNFTRRTNEAGKLEDLSAASQVLGWSGFFFHQSLFQLPYRRFDLP